MFDINKYISLFHSIQGATYKEKQKQLNDFLRVLTANTNNIEDYNALIKSITPKNHTEEIFRIEIMIALKQHELLLQELKFCNRMFLKKLLKDWQLFRKIFNDVTPDNLMNNILPYLSYALRLKVLNGVSKNVINEKLLDQYFDALKEKYGLKLASIVLPGCSSELIRATTEKYHLLLSPSHLKRIFKKDQEFVDFYFEKMKQRYENFDFSQYRSELKYIAKINPHIYWTLQKNHKLEIKFGKHMTPEMIKSHKDIIEKGTAALDMFHQLQMYKTLKKEGKLDQFLFNFYPETHDQFKETILNNKILEFLEKGPRFTQYYLINSCFYKKYNKKLLDNPRYFTESLLRTTPLDEREVILDHLIEDNDSLLYYYATEKSIPKIKQQMQHCSNAKTRAEYFQRLFDTCYVNKDKVAMLEILQHVINRYKNDTNLLKSFWQKIEKRSVYLHFFTEEHFACLFTIIKIIETSNFWLWSADLFLAKYIDQLLSHDKPIEKIIDYNIQKIIEGQRYEFIQIGTNMSKKRQKTYLGQIANRIDLHKDHEKYQNLCNKFLRYVTSINHSKNDILQYERFFKELNRDDFVYEYDSTVPKLVQCDSEFVHDLFWKLNNVIVKTELIWYAKHRPDKLKDNCNAIWKILPKYSAKTVFNQFKTFCNTDIIEEIVTHALQSIHDEDFDKIQLSISALSIMSPEVFMEQIPTAYPDSEGKIDPEEPQTKINLQRAFINGLKNVGDPSKTFPLVLKFCIGDYLKFAVPSLHSITYNMKESLIKESLNQISNTAVSVRKHILILSRHLFPIEEFYLLLTDWSEKENNLSLRNLILRKIIEYFMENPCERLWLLFKNNLNRIDSEDENIYDFLLKFKKIPLSYLPDYIEAIYYAISNNPEAKINKKKFQLANAIPIKTFDKLSHAFLQQLIKDTVCHEMSDKVYWKYVFHINTQKQLTLFGEVFRHFTEYVNTNRSNLEDPTVRARITEFVFNFAHNIVTLKRGNELIQPFKSSWLSTFTTENFVKDFILTEIAELYLQSEFDSYATGLKISGLLYEYICRYNASVIESFCQQIRTFLSIDALDTKEKELFAFIDGFFKEKRDEHIYVAVIYFLPETVPTIENAYYKYVPIFEAIKNCEVPIVKYHFDIYLSNCKLQS